MRVDDIFNRARDLHGQDILEEDVEDSKINIFLDFLSGL